MLGVSIFTACGFAIAKPQAANSVFINPMSTILFVYGSLKRGQSNHHYMAGQEFLCSVTTAPLYRLYDWGPYPALVEWPENGTAIEGELWRIDEATLARIEHLEEAPILYQMRPVAIA